MPLASLVAAALGAACLSSEATVPSRAPDRLTVAVNVSFDRSIASNVAKALAREEASAIWSGNGVDLVWTSGEPEAAFHLNVIVARGQPTAVVDRAATVLGHTTLDASGAVQGPILILADPIDALLRRRHENNPFVRDREFGQALGRVLAHEVGHAILGAPAYHDQEGLMRVAFPVAELARLERGPFRLTDGSAARLKASIARRSDAREREPCSDPVR